MLLLLSACTLSPGGGFERLERAELEVALEVGPARDLGDGGVLTDLGYEVKVASAAVGIGQVRLLELQGAATAAFDPADPPEGYSSCHGGHCHAEDGSLVPYAVIEAELAGADAELVPVVVLSAERTLDLWSGEVITLGHPGSPELPRAEISLLEAEITSLSVTATVTGGDLGEGEVPLDLDLALDEVVAGTFSWSVDRRGPPAVALGVRWVVDGTLFDGVDFAVDEDPSALLLDNLLSHRPTAFLEEP